MRIRANLLRGPRPIPARLVAIPVWLLAATLAIGATVLLVDAFALRTARVELEAHLARVNTAKAQATATTSLPPAAELDAMARRVAALNARAEVSGLDTADVLVWLEVHLPHDVQLTRLQHRAREGTVLLVAEAWRSEPLAKLLGELEKAPQFGDVLLVRQGTRGVQGRGEMVQFEIRIEMKPRQDRHA